jgi:hypothetical protein
LIAEETGDVAGAAAYVADISFALEPVSETREQFAVERFVVELGVDVASVLLGDAIVGLLNRVECSLVHTVS